MPYRAPVDAIRFQLSAVADLDADMAAGIAGEASPEVVDAILVEAARFAEGVLEPAWRQGDVQGAKIANGTVTTPQGWPEIYRQWWQAGWNGVDLPTNWGGMGLPTRLATVAMEFWTSANMAFALGPVLTQGAADALILHASDALKAAWLPKLVSGEWTATMNLTEPQAGSDLGQLRTRAERQVDGTYRVIGQKIYITFGEHDLSDNIVHLVLARLPDAPVGTKGISLFLVPKIMPDGSRNDVRCAGIEHKMGIHGAPTCTMIYGDHDGATGWLIGEENKGLACMFTMMNKARLFTGLQGVAIAETAYQRALAYAQDRKQGRALGQTDHGPHAIIHHPDVRRNLMTMRSLTTASRALAYQAAAAIDQAHDAINADARREALERAGVLTPLVKSWCTDIGCEVASLGVQIHGGMGYVEETGAAQLLRDVRITPIYEGTNGIQAIDLVTRKILPSANDIAGHMVGEQIALSEQLDGAGLQAIARGVALTSSTLDRALGVLRGCANNPERLLGMATPFLQIVAIASAMAALGKGALVASSQKMAGNTSLTLTRYLEDAAFFTASRAPSVVSHLAQMELEELPAASAFA